MTDYKQLCAELVDELEGWVAYGDEIDITNAHVLIDRARAALAEPKSEGPTDEELDELAWNWYSKTGSTWWQIEAFRAFARAVLARWGNHPESPDSSTPQPVPVSERLPGAEDCDAEGKCWLSTTETEPGWVLDYLERCTNYTHWLPAHALPLPTND